ncbi:MAG: TerB family tellurite resistance protein [Nevskiales bacterium]
MALLLLELARSDFDFPEVERVKIRDLLAQRYQLDVAQADALLLQAQATTQEAVSLYDYVKALNDRLDPAGKLGLMEMLWQVAYADGRLDKYEEGLLRKLAGLLYVSDADFIRAKLSVTG